jgi:cbb3-type cytochrome oxidase subunit 3
VLSRGDDERLRRIAEDAARLRKLAAESSNEKTWRRLLRTADGLDRAQKWQLIYPYSQWVWGARVILIMAPWALLTRYAHAALLGVVAGCAVAGIMYAVSPRRREGRSAAPARGVPQVERGGNGRSA